jgi:hypothetical protein
VPNHRPLHQSPDTRPSRFATRLCTDTIYRVLFLIVPLPRPQHSDLTTYSSPQTSTMKQSDASPKACTGDARASRSRTSSSNYKSGIAVTMTILAESVGRNRSRGSGRNRRRIGSEYSIVVGGRHGPEEIKKLDMARTSVIVSYISIYARVQLDQEQVTTPILV